MESSVGIKQLVAMFMESPFYFELSLRERLTLLRQQEWRFSQFERQDNCSPSVNLNLAKGDLPPKTDPQGSGKIINCGADPNRDKPLLPD